MKTYLQNFFITLIFSTILAFLPSTSQAHSSPIGYWQTYDLHHNPRNIVKLRIVGNELIGTLSTQTTGLCNACKAQLHNHPLKGMRIIWGLKQNGKAWESGNVLDIDSGKIYHCKVAVSEDGKMLYFTPYVGSPWLGPTINWNRVNN